MKPIVFRRRLLSWCSGGKYGISEKIYRLSVLINDKRYVYISRLTKYMKRMNSFPNPFSVDQWISDGLFDIPLEPDGLEGGFVWWERQ
jgi:hypothetical protein